MLRGGVWFSPIPVAVAAAVFALALVAVTLIRPERRRAWARWMLGASLAGVLAVTMLGGSGGSGIPNLTPGDTIVPQLTNPDYPLGRFNVIGNLAVFVPIGWLVALLAAPRLTAGSRVLVGAAAGTLLSIAIEITQGLTGRVADIDDVILNGVGALAGAVVAVALSALRRGARGDAAVVGE
ncbi:VanZ family protein [Agromyces archimandritae]|uniref:VanZ family protein n=1 Tax=Agromyces archimandritae TaxID=2781962 RepID=A0A975IPU0_9MICO|nr:VanZ family protein [Agromyces archimandritae]QTX05644.1 VanZ family protein [Agromyces archimandritae]